MQDFLHLPQIFAIFNDFSEFCSTFGTELNSQQWHMIIDETLKTLLTYLKSKTILTSTKYSESIGGILEVTVDQGGAVDHCHLQLTHQTVQLLGCSQSVAHCPQQQNLVNTALPQLGLRIRFG